MAESKRNMEERFYQLRQEVIRQQELEKLEQSHKNSSDVDDSYAEWAGASISGITRARGSTLQAEAAITRPRDAAYSDKIVFQIEKECMLQSSSESSYDDSDGENVSTASDWYRTSNATKRDDAPTDLERESARCADLERRLSQQENELQTLRVERCRYKSEHAESERRMKGLENKAENLEMREERYKLEIAKYEMREESYKLDIKKLKNERDQANARIAELQLSIKIREEEKENSMAFAREQEAKIERMNRVPVDTIPERKSNGGAYLVKKNTQVYVQRGKTATKVSI